jgi:UTP--glucose-1-phosphate uridylyltransferase
VNPLRKAVIPLAGRATRLYPASASVKKGLFPLVDRDGIVKPTIQIIVEEALASGIEEVCLIVGPDDEEAYRRPFRSLAEDDLPAYAKNQVALEQSSWLGRLGDRITFIVQAQPQGYGHAVYCAQSWVGAEPFLVMLGDHVYMSWQARPCAGQLLDAFAGYGCNVSAVNIVGEEALPFFGTVRGQLLAGETDLYNAEAIVEKPSADYARAHLHSPGLPKGSYLCFFGMHAMRPEIFDILEFAIRNPAQEGEIQFTAAQEALRQRQPYLASVIHGERFDTGVPAGLVETQLALALRSPLRSAVEQTMARFSTA